MEPFPLAIECATAMLMATTTTREKISIELPNSSAVVTLERCSDDFYRRAARFTVPIGLHAGSWICTTMVTREMRLPEFYAALTSLTGPTGKFFDSYKGSFAFPFKMTVHRGDKTFKYLLMLMNFRSMVEPNLYRVDQSSEAGGLRPYHPPFDNEITLQEITHVLSFLSGYLSGYLRTMPKWTTPFVLEVQSNGILFGYDPRTDKFFEEEYGTAEAYEEALAKWRKILPDGGNGREGEWGDVEENW
jgi:hypothetical protein